MRKGAWVQLMRQSPQGCEGLLTTPVCPHPPALQGEQPCPICYEDMGLDVAMLVHCRFGCGGNVHGKCLGWVCCAGNHMAGRVCGH